MFDTPPDNLPLETGKAPPPRVPVARQAPASSPPPVPRAPSEPGTSRPGKGKEPEDIFAGMDEQQDTRSGRAGSRETAGTASSRGSAGTVIGIIIVIMLLVALVAGAAWWFFIREDTIVQTPPPFVPEDIIIETPPTLPTDAAPPALQQPPTGITTEDPTSTEEMPPEDPVIPESVAIQAPDTDNDGLTDPEEAVFATSIVLSDSDGDTFSDGSEVQNGYDPFVVGAQLDASPRFRTAAIGTAWLAFLPVDWNVVLDPQNPGDYVIETASQNEILAHLDQKPSTMAFVDWLAINEPDIVRSTLVSFTTAGGHEGWMSANGRTAWITNGTRILVLSYMSGGSGSIDYPHIFDLIAKRVEEAS